jgi:branched-subunit amino acid transport protein
MPWSSYLIILALCMATIITCRVAPALLLKGRELPAWLSRALGYIPPAAFAALVANDLFSSELLAALETKVADPAATLVSDLNALWPLAISWIAAAVVVVVALRSKSLTWCIIVGVAAYGLLLLLPL